MKLTIFPHRRDWCEYKKDVSYNDIIEFYKGLNIEEFYSLLKLRESENRQSKRAVRPKDGDVNNLLKSTDSFFYWMKGRKGIKYYFKTGIHSLPRTISASDFNKIGDLDLELVARSIDKGLYGLIKSNLPVYTICDFNSKGPKDKKNVISHSGMISLDIDNKVTEEQLEWIKSLNPITIAPSTGGDPRPSFYIDIEDKTLSKKFGGLSELHEAYFDYFYQMFLEKGIQIDKACRNINRLFYISPNPTFDFYQCITPFKYVLPDDFTAKIVERQPKRISLPNTQITASEFTEEDKNDLLTELDNFYIYCLENNYQPFYDGSNMYPRLRDFHYSISNVLTNEEVINILCKYMTLSRLDNRLKGTEYEKRGYDYLTSTILTAEPSTSNDSWRYIFTLKKLTEVEINSKTTNLKLINLQKIVLNELADYPPYTFLHGCYKRAKDDLDILKRFYHFLTNTPFEEGFYLNSTKEIYNFLSPFLDIKINVLNGNFSINGMEQIYDMHESISRIELYIINTLKDWRTIKIENGKEILKKTVTCECKTYLDAPIIEYYNPISKYFNSLTPSIETTEIEKVEKLLNETTLNNGGRKFLDWTFGIIKNAFSDSYYDRILYMYSAKGSQGKTWFLQKDLIKPLSQYISTDFNFNIENKDDKFKMTENLILIDDEGNSTSRRADDAKKAISSKIKVSERKVFERRKSSLKRIASICVCLNNDEISSASNYDRRSLVLHIPDVYWKDESSLVRRWRKEIDADLFWSQMYQLWKRDPHYEFINDDEIIDESNLWKQESTSTSLIDFYLKKPTPKSTDYVIMSHIDIKHTLEQLSGKTINMSLNGILKTKGFENVKMQKCPKTNQYKSGYKVKLVNILDQSLFVTYEGDKKDYFKHMAEQAALLNKIN